MRSFWRSTFIEEGTILPVVGQGNIKHNKTHYLSRETDNKYFCLPRIFFLHDCLTFVIIALLKESHPQILRRVETALSLRH